MDYVIKICPFLANQCAVQPMHNKLIIYVVESSYIICLMLGDFTVTYVGSERTQNNYGPATGRSLASAANTTHPAGAM